MNRRGNLICFVGIDGAGKTTHAKFLVKKLKNEGLNCRYVYGRLKPFILRPFILIGNLFLLRKKRTFIDDYKTYNKIKRKTIKKHRFLSKIYQYILLADYALQILIKFKIPILLGKNIVADRYIYDTLITDLSIDMEYSLDEIKSLLDKMLRFFPRPDLVFLIDVPEEVAYKRKKDIVSIEYIKERREKYLQIGKDYGMIILDGRKNKEEVQEEIVRRVLEWMKQ